jgi:hypothetical protein
MFIQRNFDKTEADDFKLNVEKHLTKGLVATPLYDDGAIMLGWKIHQKRE